MRICLVNPTTILRRPIGELAHLLAEDGHSVTIAWSQERNDHWGAGHFDKLVHHTNIHVVPIWSKEIRSLIWPIPLDWDLSKKIRSMLDDHDIVQSWAPFYIFTHHLLKTAAHDTHRARVMVSLDTIPAYSFPFGSVIDPIMKWYLSKLAPYLHQLDSIAVYSEMLIPYLRQAMPNLDLQTVTVLPTGTLFTENSKSQNPKPKKISNFKFQISKPIVLFIGLLNTRKGIDIVIKTAQIVSQTIPEVQFLVAGTSQQQPFWEKQAENLIAKGAMKFLGRSSDVAPLYQQADIFFLPSRGEGLPGVIMEAMAYGLPIVSSDIPCIPDLVEHGSNGYLCNPKNPEEFASRIIELLDNQRLKNQFGINSQEKIKEFSWSKVYPQYINLYQRLIK